ncbi:MAG: hypothetical protein Q9227_002503 [Pyrenula ochraceoflavens]
MTQTSSISPKPSPYGIKANLLIPGDGSPIPSATVIINGPKIAWVGPSQELPTEWASVPIKTHVPYLLPGLWDCHVHFLGVLSPIDTVNPFATSPTHIGLRLSRDAPATLNAGFTSVRDVGGYGLDLAKAIKEGTVRGPNIYSAGSIIGMTGGRPDNPQLPLSIVNSFNSQTSSSSPTELADGVDGATLAVRHQLRKGAHLIKIAATGGALQTNPHSRQYSTAELRAFVSEAQRSGLIVAAHCHGTEGILACVRAGVHTIEHGSFLDEEVIKEMKEKGVVLVATRTVFQRRLEMADPNGEGYEEIRGIVEAHRRSYELAVKRGVKIALGTDIDTTSTTSTNDSPLAHGRNGKELYYAVEAGMTPLQAIRAGTAIGPETLGSQQAPLSGQIREGYDADLIGVEENPLEDIDVLGEAGNVRWVWKGGVVEKAPRG